MEKIMRNEWIIDFLINWRKKHREANRSCSKVRLHGGWRSKEKPVTKELPDGKKNRSKAGPPIKTLPRAKKKRIEKKNGDKTKNRTETNEETGRLAVTCR